MTRYRLIPILCFFMTASLTPSFGQDIEAVSKRLLRAVKKDELSLEQAARLIEHLREMSHQNHQRDFEVWERERDERIELERRERAELERAERQERAELEEREMLRSRSELTFEEMVDPLVRKGIMSREEAEARRRPPRRESRGERELSSREESHDRITRGIRERRERGELSEAEAARQLEMAKRLRQTKSDVPPEAPSLRSSRRADPERQYPHIPEQPQHGDSDYERILAAEEEK